MSGSTGLLLGAGTSYELGMPLVWDLTHELKRWLTPEKLRMFNDTWKNQGTGFSDEAIEDFLKSLQLKSLHYESILGHLETQFMRNRHRQSDYHGLYSWFIEAVYVILLERHTRNLGYIQKNIHFYDGLKKLVPVESPLWVFSLNHDLMIECIAAHNAIPLSTGFSSETVVLPKRNSRGQKIGELKGEILRGEALESSAMSFLGPRNSGINLLKIHGSLEVFTFQDGKDLLRILPSENSVGAWIECLRAANEELIYLDSKAPGGKVKVSNEIAYADESGEMQFLRRTLLSGAYKFDKRATQVLPKKMLDHFRSNINHVSTLVCAGYGFGDNHINEIVRDWLSFSSSRRLVVVDPFRNEVPASILHLSMQIDLHQSSFTDFLDQAADIVRSRREKLEKELAGWARKNQFDPSKKSEFDKFIQDSMDDRIQSLAEDVARMPFKNGDIDVEAMGLTTDELVKDILNKNKVDMDDLLEQFMEHQRKK